ncbi:P-loop containing nucleoside triphosphate hydrolase protein [Amniculicola lignicola CBS 123094]|uniref:Structural maintenance of chromosomes protein 5 n=1 Tax=Amniculicola lignicola CBS 123094 TaxID=1392246 RepID=A0A6A5W9V7_9PLEO|nr:P-loop containing nucleoside triphosphate hydrolase protein [Amniculicola lignicola CBS 123094]
MPGIVNGHRKRTRVVSDDDDDSEPPSSVSSASKRARRDRDASTEYAVEAHQPGAIVRVKLTNFVTYTAAEFHPGPSLNMVIGPNGTGKSTLVCAICLGLGSSPANLGRAKEPGEFVKHGSAEAAIEIELAAGDAHRTNPIIRRTIRKEGNKSQYYIDGTQVSQKQVVALAKSFNIQIDNLCQFLPQDRVVEFAQLKPVDLLRETQRAAAPEHMWKWHDQLIILGKAEKGLHGQIKSEDAHLARLKSAQIATNDDVVLYQDRQALMEEAKTLQIVRPIIETNILRRDHEAVKVEIVVAKRELQQLTAEAAPARAAQEEMETYASQINQVTGTRRKQFEDAKQVADTLVKSLKVVKESISEFQSQIEAEKEAEKQRRQDAKRCEGEVARFDRLMQEEPIAFDHEAYRAQMRDLTDQQSSTNIRLARIRQRGLEIKNEGQELSHEFQLKTNERAALDTQSGKQAKLLQQRAPVTGKVWTYIQDHREELRLLGEVHGPPILTCSVTNPQYADAVEAFLGPSDFTAITCTNSVDTRKITKIMYEQEKLYNFSIRTVPKERSFYTSPVTREELEGRGFAGWISDYIQGPDPVLAMLCDSKSLHRTAFSPRKLSHDQYTEFVNGPINTCVTGDETLQIKRRREYGAQSTVRNNLRKAQWFTDQPVDLGEKRRLDEELGDLNHRLSSLKEERTALQQENAVLGEQLRDAKARIDDAKMKQKAVAEFNMLPQKKAGKEAELNQCRGLMKETIQKMTALKTKIELASLRIVSMTLEYTKSVVELRSIYEGVIEAEIRLAEAASEADAFKEANRQILQALQEKKSALEELKTRKSQIQSEYNTKVNQIKRLVEALSEAEQEIVTDKRHLQTVEELDALIEGIEGKLSCMAEGNPRAVQQFRDREVQINKTEKTLEKCREDLENTKAQIDEIRTQWEPEVDALVEKISEGFSHNFAQIGCAGQVGVHKDEEYENWSIQIQVRFRENESMAILDSHRQSGGERAVSTIFYLMALQGLARSPFRVVDEINQGMDPRNERMVHERMVDIACKERTSQYFLITPKLLNDLKFHPKMKVHCIASGENMPDQYDTLDFQKLAKLAMRVKQNLVA